MRGEQVSEYVCQAKYAHVSVSNTNTHICVRVCTNCLHAIKWTNKSPASNATVRLSRRTARSDYPALEHVCEMYMMHEPAFVKHR